MTTLLAFFVLLGVLITVHELGHFLVAKACGVRVLTFSIGFGPKLFGFTRGDTDYRVSVLPLGGYVRMFGDDITAEVPAEERRFAYLQKSYPQKMAISFAGPAANLLLAFVVYFGLSVGTETVADPVAGTVLAGEPAALAGVLPGDRIIAVEGQPIAMFNDLVTAIAPRAGQPTTLTIQRPGTAAPLQLSATPSSSPSPDPRVTTPVGRLGLLSVRALPLVAAADGSAAKAAGIVYGDRVLDVDGVAVTTRDELFERLAAIKPTADVTLTVERKDDKGATAKHAIVVAGAPAAAIAVPACIEGELDVGGEPVPCPPALPAPVVVAPPLPKIAALTFAVVDSEMTAPINDVVGKTANLVVAAVRAQAERRGITSVEGTIASLEPDSAAAARHVEVNGHRVVAIDGHALALSSDMPAALAKDPDGIHVVGLVDKAGNGATFVLRLKPITASDANSRQIFGASLAGTLGDAATSERHVGVGDAVVRAFLITWQTIKAVAGSYISLFSGEVGLDELGGTVMLANVAGDAARAGLAVFAGFLAVISVNLAVLNLLPVPVLDGGHMLLFTIEAVRRKPLSVNARIKATWIGLIFVGALMIVANGNDIYKLITGAGG